MAAQHSHQRQVLGLDVGLDFTLPDAGRFQHFAVEQDAAARRHRRLP
jgi:hypothetical protein